MRTSIILVIFLATSFHGFSQFNLKDLIKPAKANMSSDSLLKMDTYFHNLVDTKELAGIQTAILRQGKLVHFDSYGHLDIEKKIPLDDKSIFRIFSMTKPIVSVALMQLYEQGKFKLEDPLYKYIPEFKEMNLLNGSILEPAKNPIKIIDLLRHTSGFNYGNIRNTTLNKYYSKADLHSSKNNEEFVLKLSKIPLQFEPGTNWQYGLSTNICGYLIEKLSGQSLNNYLIDSILKPLKMKDTHFQLPKEKIKRFSTGYGWNNQNGLFVSENSDDNRYINKVTLYNGGGGLVSTTYDYLRFCQMLLNKGKLDGKRLLKEETLDLMFSDQLKDVRKHQTERLRLPLGEASFGLGFAIRGANINSLENVFGWGGAVGTYFKIDLKHNLAYVMMIQLSPYRQLGLRQRIQNFVDSAIIK